jgi:WD40 repeat protein
VAFSPDGKLVASGSLDRTVRLWDAASGHELRQLQGHEGPVWAVCFGPGGRLATGGEDGAIRVWEAASGRELRRLKAGSTVWGIRFTPRGGLVVGTGDGRASLWSPSAPTSRVVGRHRGRVYRLDLHPASGRLATPSSDGTVRVWDLARPDATLTLSGHRGEVNIARFTPDGGRLVTSSDDATIRLWDARSGLPVWRAPLLHAVPTGVELYSHRTRAAGLTRRWQRAVHRRARLASLERGQLCLVAHDGVLELWRTATDERVWRRPARGARVPSRVVSLPAGCLTLAPAGVALHDARGARRRLAGAGASAVAWDPDRREILLAVKREVRVLDGAGARLRSLRADVAVTALAGTPRWIVAGYRDGNMELLARRTGRRRAGQPRFEGVSPSPVLRMVPGPGGTLVAGYSDGLVGLWLLQSGLRLDHARLHGAVTHLLLHGRTLHAATELGGRLRWELDHLEGDRCALLREVWRRVPTAWRDGRPLVLPPPDDHPCRRGGR